MEKSGNTETKPGGIGEVTRQAELQRQDVEDGNPVSAGVGTGDGFSLREVI